MQDEMLLALSQVCKDCNFLINTQYIHRHVMPDKCPQWDTETKQKFQYFIKIAYSTTVTNNTLTLFPEHAQHSSDSKYPYPW